MVIFWVKNFKIMKIMNFNEFNDLFILWYKVGLSKFGRFVKMFWTKSPYGPQRTYAVYDELECIIEPTASSIIAGYTVIRKMHFEWPANVFFAKNYRCKNLKWMLSWCWNTKWVPKFDLWFKIAKSYNLNSYKSVVNSIDLQIDHVLFLLSHL